MSRYPYEGLVVTVGTLAVLIPAAIGLKALAASWSLGWFLGFSAVAMAGLLLLGRWLDIRDNARKKSDQRSLPPVLDLPRSDYRSQSSPGKTEAPEREVS